VEYLCAGAKLVKDTLPFHSFLLFLSFPFANPFNLMLKGKGKLGGNVPPYLENMFL